jgi:dipeptidyl aminopeptidase/acylaminoacyl peptidase
MLVFRCLAGVIILLVCELFATAPAPAAFPGANGRVIFNGGEALDTVDEFGADLRELVPGQDGLPIPSEAVWSADGQRIAFVVDFVFDNTRNQEIFVMNADGSGVTNLTNAPGNDWQPAWSPDGTRIAFTSARGGSHALWTMNADGSDQVRLRPGGEEPAWSPDGSKIAFTYSSDLYVISPDGTGETRLIDSPSRDADPAWSPDSQRIVFARIVDFPTGCERYCYAFHYDLFTVGPEGANLTRLTTGSTGDNNGVNSANPAWSPDGTKIVFVRYLTNGGEGFNLRIINSDGSGERDFIPDESPPPDPYAVSSWELYPDWQAIPNAPKRSDYDNASAYCKALRDFLGNTDFGKRYKNHGKCVSTNH